MFQWVQGRGATREASEHGRLSQVELHGSAFTSRLIFQPKVDRRGGIDTIGLVAVVDTIQVHLHDVMLGIMAIDLRCEHDLFELTHNCSLVAHNQILNQLLGNCASALYRPSTVQVVKGCTDDTQDVDARVGPEIFVFGGHRCIYQDRRHLFE